uniref:Uncharacterized protein n=1 Tax=uncultured marine virus TaxID=186617 RepID=A0A0F7L7W2_9VIRU|nr:hypothetical protein [uncultured marine virus]
MDLNLRQGANRVRHPIEQEDALVGQLHSAGVEGSMADGRSHRDGCAPCAAGGQRLCVDHVIRRARCGVVVSAEDSIGRERNHMGVVRFGGDRVGDVRDPLPAGEDLVWVPAIPVGVPFVLPQQATGPAVDAGITAASAPQPQGLHGRLSPGRAEGHRGPRRVLAHHSTRVRPRLRVGAVCGVKVGRDDAGVRNHQPRHHGGCEVGSHQVLTRGPLLLPASRMARRSGPLRRMLSAMNASKTRCSYMFTATT